MTNSELIDNLQRAQAILSEVYDWASKVGEGQLQRNASVSSAVSCADTCIWEALEALDYNE
jgi:hypothetical protein